MCTVSWLHNRHGYDLLCNRDERLSRSGALLPRIDAIYGVRHIAPIDPDGGGTWIGANEYGVTVCLLNAYPAVSMSGVSTSRGRLVRSLLASRSAMEAITLVCHRDLTRFAPFTIAVLQPRAPACVAAWDGRYLLMIPDANDLCPLTSSSVEPAMAHIVRREEWMRRRRACGGEENLEMLEAFHRSHSPWPGPWSVCMHRDGAATVSFTHVSVSADRVQMHYSPDAPCKADLLVTTTISHRPLHDFSSSPARAFHLAG